jgi:streptogramin lyase
MAGHVEARIPVPLPGGPWIGKVAFGAGSLWVRKGGDDEVLRIDPRTNHSHHSGSLSRIDPRGNRVVATVRISTQIQLAGPKAIAAAGGMVWVADAYAGALVRVDPQRNRRVESIGETGTRLRRNGPCRACSCASTRRRIESSPDFP